MLQPIIKICTLHVLMTGMRIPMSSEKMPVSPELMDLLEEAFYEGWNDGVVAGPGDFSAWFDKNYSVIIEEGTESPAGEKIALKDGFGNVIREVEIPPYFAKSRRLF